MSRPADNICPECWQDKHANCDGTALNESTDEIVECDCRRVDHWACFVCGNLLDQVPCVNGRNHCEKCSEVCIPCQEASDG